MTKQVKNKAELVVEMAGLLHYIKAKDYIISRSKEVYDDKRIKTVIRNFATKKSEEDSLFVNKVLQLIKVITK